MLADPDEGEGGGDELVGGRRGSGEDLGLAVVAEAQARSILMGRRITIHGAQETYEAVAEALEPDGSLRVRCADGQARIVSGGEVSISGWDAG